MAKNIYKIGKELFITSDEEIKEGDWCHTIGTSLFNEQIGKVTKQVIKDNGKYGIVFKKIILTTDQDLIKDGVQAIDNEFLEWFVKNPSCEEVEIERSCLDETAFRHNIITYKIIIPKEEPKQENFYDKLVEYFINSPEEKILEDWEKSAEFDNVGVKMDEFLKENNKETFEEFPIHNFMSIEPTNKKQQKELESNRIRLGIKNKEEDFVLKCLLSFDWKREVILYEVEKVSFTGNGIDFRVRVKAPSKTVDYCCSNPFKEEGWGLERPDFNSRAREVWWQLNRYITR